MISTFLVFLSILQSSEFFQSAMPALYLITGTAHTFMAFAVFPELSFYFSIAFNLFMYSFLIFSFLYYHYYYYHYYYYYYCYHFHYYHYYRWYY